MGNTDKVKTVGNGYENRSGNVKPSYPSKTPSYRVQTTSDSLTSLLNKYTTKSKNDKTTAQETSKTEKTLLNRKPKEKESSSKLGTSVRDVPTNRGQLQNGVARKDTGPPITYNRLFRGDSSISKNSKSVGDVKKNNTHGSSYENDKYGSRDKLDIPVGRMRSNSQSTIGGSRGSSPICRSSYFEKSFSRETSPETNLSSNRTRRTTVHLFQDHDSFNINGLDELDSANNRLSKLSLGYSRDPKNTSRSRDTSPVHSQFSYMRANKNRSREPSPGESIYNHLKKDEKLNAAMFKATEEKKNAIQEFLLEKRSSVASNVESKLPKTTPMYKYSLNAPKTSSRSSSRDPSPSKNFGSSLPRYSGAYMKHPAKPNTSTIDPCISYMTKNEYKPRVKRVSVSGTGIPTNYSKASTIEDKYETTNKEIEQISKQIEDFCNGETVACIKKSVLSERRQSTVPKIMVKVNVVERSTSPLYSKDGIFLQYSKNSEIISKTILRPLDQVQQVNKDVQCSLLQIPENTAQNDFIDQNHNKVSSVNIKLQQNNGTGFKSNGTNSQKNNGCFINNNDQSNESPESSNKRNGIKNKDFRKSILNMQDSEQIQKVMESRESSTESTSSATTSTTSTSTETSSDSKKISPEKDTTTNKQYPFLLRAFENAPKFEFRKKSPPDETEWLGTKANCKDDITTDSDIPPTSNQFNNFETQSLDDEESEQKTLYENGSTVDDVCEMDIKSCVNKDNIKEIDYWETINSKKEATPQNNYSVFNYFENSLNSLTTDTTETHDNENAGIPNINGSHSEWSIELQKQPISNNWNHRDEKNKFSNPTITDVNETPSIFHQNSSFDPNVQSCSQAESLIRDLITKDGFELEQTLISLKHIFNEDKELASQFVLRNGLHTILHIAKRNLNSNCILLALNELIPICKGIANLSVLQDLIEWLYCLVSSKNKNIVKSALKVLMLFLEVYDNNCIILLNAIHNTDNSKGVSPWYSLISLLIDHNDTDFDVHISAAQLINATLVSIHDKILLNNQIKFLNHHGMDNIVQRYMCRPKTDLILLHQLQQYEMIVQAQNNSVSEFSLNPPEPVFHNIHDKNLQNQVTKEQSPASKIFDSEILHEELKPKFEENVDDKPNFLNEIQQRCSQPKEIELKEQEDISSPFMIEGMVGLISKAKEELCKTKIRSECVVVSVEEVNTSLEKKEVIKKSETDLQWEEIVKGFDRELKLCDMDFTDLTEDDDEKNKLPKTGCNIPPPPPPLIGLPKLMNDTSKTKSDMSIIKTKKTVKLFWKEIRDDPLSYRKTVWDELPKTDIDTLKLEYLFESRAKENLSKDKQQEVNKSKEIVVLDHKRSNAINIAITKLPPPRAIKIAIVKMDSSVVNREGIEKLLALLPTDEEIEKIQEAHMANPDLPLGNAEQFLLTLSTIPELDSRLKLWAFKLDFETLEKEIAEPLMDLKQGIHILRQNETFRCILAHLRQIGIFLNGNSVKGFEIEYLSKVPEVKDTVQKHSLLHHLCLFIMESSAITTDLYSEIGPITRASRTDFAELAHNITYLESECKASWNRLSLISKHDISTQTKQKLFEFLVDSTERIVILSIVHRRVLNRFKKFLLWLGMSTLRVNEAQPNVICRTLSEFALEYRTTRERVLQQIDKKQNFYERQKSRNKLSIDVSHVNSTNNEETGDDALRQLLEMDSVCSNVPEVDFTLRRRKAENIVHGKSNQEVDDDLFETLVKTANKETPGRTNHRERKRSRNTERKSILLKRSRTREGFVVGRKSITPN